MSDFIIVDDPYRPKDVLTEEDVQKAIDWWEQVEQSRKRKIEIGGEGEGEFHSRSLSRLVHTSRNAHTIYRHNHADPNDPF